MAFIVKKKISGKEYYYLNETRRVNGKVVSKCISYLGKDKNFAEKKASEILKKIKIKKNGIDRKMEELKHEKISIEELSNFCRSKGFVFRSSDIYGGFAGFWDFGPLGVELFNNIKADWWNFFVHQNSNIVGIDSSIISHPKTWKASGHLDNFNDVFVKCKKCKKTNKLDEAELGKIKCDCGGEYEKIGKFNLMFETDVGVLKREKSYLRGETAQGMFMDFKLIQQTSRMQLPFGIAQIGKCFRNEIAPRDFLFRSREFNIAEFEFFILPDEIKCELLKKEQLNVRLDFLDAETQKAGKQELKKTTIKKMLDEKRLEEWHAYWLAEQIRWYRSLGLDEVKIREHTKAELSHYSSATFDVDYEYPFGSQELGGNANRGQYDLTQHQKESSQKMELFDEKSGKKILPKVIEPTFGLERIFLALLTKAYSKNSKGDVVLKLPLKLAPIKAAIFPIVKQPDFEKIAKDVFDNLKKEFNVVYDHSGSIGKRYARNDEVGTCFCITVDGDSLKNKDVTVRERDTTKQIRIKLIDLKGKLKKIIDGEINFENAGKLIN